MVKYLRAIGFDSARPIAGFVFCLTAVLATSQTAANEIAQWNDTTMKAIAANGQNNLVATRTLAMVQVAVHDALNAISRRYDAYYFEGPGDPAASPDAAIAAAAHTVLVGVVGSFGTPAQKVATLALVDQAYAASIARGVDEPDLRARLQRSEERRRQGQHGPHRGPDSDRAFLVRRAGRLEHDRAHRRHDARSRCQRQRPRSGPDEHGDGGRLHRGVEDPLRVRFLAPRHCHSRG